MLMLDMYLHNQVHFECDICRRNFKLMLDLCLHDQVRFEFDMCGKNFKLMLNLWLHKVHFKCDMCSSARLSLTCVMLTPPQSQTVSHRHNSPNTSVQSQPSGISSAPRHYSAIYQAIQWESSAAHRPVHRPGFSVHTGQTSTYYDSNKCFITLNTL